jgi:outer membrane receptor protein involved in Fe transport
MLCGAAIVALVGGTAAFAQGGDNIEDPNVEILVTGSRLRTPNDASVSPVVEVNAADIARRGAVRVEDVLNTLPQVLGSESSYSSDTNVATGTATVDLRGLGASRTLVLINGRRLPYGAPDSIPSDLNQVPTPLIESVEVLTGGASAVYGSDAIAGVVNIKLRTDFEGIKATAGIVVHQHTNDNSDIRALISQNAATSDQYKLADKNVWNGFSKQYSLAAGISTPDKAGNITVWGNYRETQPILEKDYDATSCSLAAGPNGYVCSGSSAAVPANIINGAGVSYLPQVFYPTNGQFQPGLMLYNAAPRIYLQRPDTQYSLGASGHYEINEHFQPYFEASYTHDRSVAQAAPNFVLVGSQRTATALEGINCDNPYLSAAQANFLCTAGGLSTGSNYDANGNYVSPQATVPGLFSYRRLIESTNRRTELEHSTVRFVGGVKGKLAGPFDYDVSASYANVTYKNRLDGQTDLTKMQYANNAVIDQRPGSTTFGKIVCQVNADASSANDQSACSPIDPFGDAGISPAAAKYITISKLITGSTSLSDFIGVINGDLGKWGVQSPLANSGVSMVLGAEYRRNTLDYQPDETYQTDGFTVILPIDNAAASSTELFGELRVPLVEDMPFFKSLSFEGAYRYSDYKVKGQPGGTSTNTYKLGLNWAPVSDLRFRGSFQRAVRVPNIIELFQSNQQSMVVLNRLSNGAFDPCATTTPLATAAQCALMGVSPTQYGHILDAQLGEYSTLIGGNPNLQPEVSKTYSLGAQVKPSFIPNLSVSIDYFHIKVNNLVGTIAPSLALQQCLSTGDPYFCNLIVRDPTSGQPLFGGYFVSTNLNTGSLMTSGWDIAANYAVDLNRLGRMTLTANGTVLDSYEVKPLPDSSASDIFDCAGLYGSACGRPRPKFRSNVVLSWETPVALTAAVTWRHISRTKIAMASDQTALAGSFTPIDKYMGARDYFDLDFDYRLTSSISLRAGVTNIFDRDPPRTTSGATEGNGQTYPQIYDATGRTMFLTATASF